MAEIREIGITVATQSVLLLTDDEVKAIDALVGYGIDSFLAAFYKHLGTSYRRCRCCKLRWRFRMRSAGGSARKTSNG